MPTLSDYTNVYGEAVKILREKGYQVWQEGMSQMYCAEKDGWDFMAESPTALLGLVAIFEHRLPKRYTEYWWRTGDGSDCMVKDTPEFAYVSRIARGRDGRDGEEEPDAVALARECAAMQSDLLVALHMAYPEIASSLSLTWPRRVALCVDGVAWGGTRHGNGYRFESSDGRILEAHDCIREQPYPIDAYRLSVYALSRSATARQADSDEANSNEERMHFLLLALEQAGVVVRDVRARHHLRYLVVERRHKP